ncbi:Prolyl-tRNA editing protein ProX [Rhodovastum atsumiense]|uniref:Prolyl-tRNA synthetase associated domain-containing protein n=1 Tax=Rhodovastum atsumiense TaxID=504468 RepID=A0A5M6IX10_9PROT|nr:prolyl-tRNA synthetase associated domain-containing protein [Rhodovastum atsumiense]KAA5612866.1 prolyl-tRNA synthetase associated domain-containing protein [Rhodovastum atsumiense]CAH2601064.1 Prolyl-tRNA editing protein ProX [Rhodovastum atsumiense]
MDLPWTKDRMLAELQGLGITYALIEHPPLRTVEETHGYWDHLPGLTAKNLLLKDAGGRFWLVVAPGELRVDLKALPARIGSKRLSFAGPDDLAATLAVEPGAVTPLAVVNDPTGRVSVVLDRSLAGPEPVKVHPLVNTASVAVAGEALLRFLAHHGHPPAVVDLPSR